MCIFTHFAAGALAGGMTGHVGWAVAAGLASHALLDVFPHYDFESWRVEVSLGLVTLGALLLLPFATAAAVAGGLAGCLPDLENLLWKLGRLDRRRMVFPTHTGLIPHGPVRGPRNLIVQAALVGACLTALGLVSPPAAQGAPESAVADQQANDVVFGLPESRLLASTDDVTRIDVVFPVMQPPADWGSVDPARILWQEPGPTIVDAQGNSTPTPPVHRINLALPTTTPPAWEVIRVAWWREPDVDIGPEELVTVAGPSLFRDVPIATVIINPEAPGGGLLAGVTIALRHAPNGRQAEFLNKARAEPELDRAAARRAFGGGSVLNRALHAELAAGAVVWRHAENAAAAKLRRAEPFGLTSHWVRIEVNQTGVHALTGYDMSLLGISLAQVDSATLRLYRGSGRPLPFNPEAPSSWTDGWVGFHEVAIQLRDSDGVWGSGDAIVFYGFPGDCWSDRLDLTAPRLGHFEHPGMANGVYWLTWEAPGTPSPLPGSPLRVPLVGAPANGVTPTTIHRVRQHVEQSYEEAIGRVADNWAWDTHIATQREYSFQAGTVVADSAALMVVDVRSNAGRFVQSTVQNQCSAWLNDNSAGSLSATWTVAQEEDSLRVRLVGFTSALHSGANRLTIRHGRPGSPPELLLDSFDLLYWSPLSKPAVGQLAFAHWADQVAAPAAQVDLQIAAATPSAVKIWDVSAADAPLELLGTPSDTPSGMTLGLQRDPVTSRHFVLFTDGEWLTPPVRRRPSASQVADLRSPNTIPAVDYVIIYDPLFETAASLLLPLRADHLPGVETPAAVAVSEEAIYNNFSGGAKDPLALRNFLKWLYNRDGRVRWVCLLGDASRDYRNYLQHDPASQLYDYLPTPIRTVFPRRPVAYNSYYNDPYATDDGLVCFDVPTGGRPLDIPDLATGRLTARNASEAIGMVERIRALATLPLPGPWRNHVVFCADDLDYRGSSYETYHMQQAEVLGNSYLPWSLDLTKLYMHEYQRPPGSVYKPAARQEARRLLGEGTTIFHYIGHGSDNTLADEQVFLTEDILTLANGMRRGLFLAFSCDVGIYDSPTNQSMAETFVAQTRGGAIASICASQVSWVGPNDRLSSYFYRDLYPLRSVDPAVSLGEALLSAKVGIGNDAEAVGGVFSIWMANSQRYILFGDPALVLPQPRTGLVFAAESADTLHAGKRERVLVDLGASGVVPGDGVGYDLRVEESRSNRTALSLNYWQPGAAAYRGTGSVTSSPLDVAFKVPAQLHFGPTGKVRVIIETPDELVAGASHVPIVASPLGPVDDVSGPTISLAFPDDRRRVPPGALVQAVLSDTSGVSIAGTTLANSVLFEVDNSGFMSNVSRGFIFDPGSYTTGRVDIALPTNLTLGRHLLRVYGSDVLGNVGTDTLSFRVIATGVSGIADPTVFPNPTPGPCRLVFELSDPMDVRWEVYTVAGRRIWQGRERFATAGPKVLEWDGRDSVGGEIANGVYLYVLRGSLTDSGDGLSSDGDSREVTHTGQVVIMR